MGAGERSDLLASSFLQLLLSTPDPVRAQVFGVVVVGGSVLDRAGQPIFVHPRSPSRQEQVLQ